MLILLSQSSCSIHHLEYFSNHIGLGVVFVEVDPAGCAGKHPRIAGGEVPEVLSSLTPKIIFHSMLNTLTSLFSGSNLQVI